MGWTSKANIRRKERYWSRKREAIQILGGQCVWCNSTEALQLDHIDRSTREYRFPHFYKCGDQIFYEEVNKCQLLCRSCHAKKVYPKEVASGEKEYTEISTTTKNMVAGVSCAVRPIQKTLRFVDRWERFNLLEKNHDDKNV